MTTKFNPTTRSVAFPQGNSEITTPCSGKVSEKPDVETGSREAGIFRHHLAETAMRGLAKHISPLFTVPYDFYKNEKFMFLVGIISRYCSQ